MKNIFKKIKNKIDNSGSGLVLVIVALAFVGILAGALLTAVASVYRLKLYDYNAKSNFYYLEQAMDEIYAGVGTQTMTDMQEAYQDTREKVIYYDAKTKSYKNVGNDKANKLFKDSFMSRIANESFYNVKYKQDPISHEYYVDDTSGLAKELKGLISNNSVELVSENLKVLRLDENGNPFTSGSTHLLSKVVIKDVTLKRTSEYNRSTANGMFTQTISTDIEISRPDFDVNFNSNNLDIDNLFSYCLVADSGVEINSSQNSNLMINGNIYAATDFYNKTYNQYDLVAETKLTKPEFSLNRVTDDGEVDTVTYKMNKIYNRSYGDDEASTLRNYNAVYNKNITALPSVLYDGNNDNSKYSGLFIDGTNVNILADYVIVPGSISVMNAGGLTVFGRDGSEISQANVWTDEVVLSGYVPKEVSTKKEKGANAYFDANLYVKDDTQIESNSANLKVSGGYYGYSNSTTSDDRLFVPTTKKDKNHNYIYEQVVDKTTNKKENRGHYNSSAIVVNSKNAIVDLSELETLYIAGRSYVELSHLKNGTVANSHNGTSFDIEDDIYDANNKVYKKGTYNVNETNNTYAYNSDIDDYKTGESISVKSSQLAYVPDKTPMAVYVKNSSGDSVFDHYECDVDVNLGKSSFFKKYFGAQYDSDNNVSEVDVSVVPVIYTEDTVNGTTKKMYFIDFDYVVANKLYNKDRFDKSDSDITSDYLKAQFIKDYFDYFDYSEIYKGTDADAKLAIPHHTDSGSIVYDVDTRIMMDDIESLLTDVTEYIDYFAGQIAIPNLDSTSNTVFSYSSGVLTNTSHGTSGSNDNGEIFKVKTDVNNPNSDAKNKRVIDNSDVTFNVVTAKDSLIESTLEGSITTAFNEQTVRHEDGTVTVDKINNTINFSNEYQKHYNYVKWALMDLEETSQEAGVVNDIVSSNGEGCITPINRYMNFDNIKSSDNLMSAAGGSTETNINPDNLDLGDYKVWVSNDDVHIECKASDNNNVTGIIISKGDVYFDTVKDIEKNDSVSNTEAKKRVVNNFSGIIITGGKVYVNNDVTNISSSDLCRNIINSCITKTVQGSSTYGTSTSSTAVHDEAFRAARVLSLFKSYEDDAKAAEDAIKAARKSSAEEHKDDVVDPDSPLSISNIDYSDVIRYNNWKRNVD